MLYVADQAVKHLQLKTMKHFFSFASRNVKYVVSSNYSIFLWLVVYALVFLKQVYFSKYFQQIMHKFNYQIKIPLNNT